MVAGAGGPMVGVEIRDGVLGGGEGRDLREGKVGMISGLERRLTWRRARHR